MRRIVQYQGPLLAWAGTIFVLSSSSQITVIPMPYQLDKLVHAIVYGVLAWTAHRAFFHQTWWETGRRWSVMLAIVFATVYGLTDEFHQSYVPGRIPSFLDLGADVFGAVVAVWFIRWRRRAEERRVPAD